MAAAAQRSFKYESESFRSYCQRQFGTDLDYTFDSVALLDGVLTECYHGVKSMNETEAWTFLQNVTHAAGAYLGEVIVRNANGVWACTGDESRVQDWYVSVAAKGGEVTEVPVFNAVFTFLEKGPQETLLALVAPLLTSRGEWPVAKVAAKRSIRKAASIARRR